MIYLDHNATSILRPQVREAMEVVASLPLNASSVHAGGRKAKQMLEEARRTLADYLSVFSHEIVFTASATEANNTILRALAPTHRLLVSAVEHPCILNTAALLGGDTIAVDANGIILPDVLEEKLASLNGAPALVSVMLANNETGVIQPVAEAATICKKYGAKLHCDAVQAFGKIPLDAGMLGVDYLTISAHKIGGPVGVGVLVLRDDKGFVPLLTGGGQESGRRAGTENIAAIIGMTALLPYLNLDAQRAQWQQLHIALVKAIHAVDALAPIYGEAAPRLSNTLMLGMPGMPSETQLMHFDLSGVAVSAGSACSSGRITSSHVLRAMGVDTQAAGQAIRVSLGWNTTETDIAAFAEAWKVLHARHANGVLQGVA